MSLARRVARVCLHAVPPVQDWLYGRRALRAAARIDPSRPESIPVLVYQMGKVGSSSVVRTLEGHGCSVLSVHFLVPAEIEAAKAYRLRVGGVTRAGYMLTLGEAIGARIAEIGGRVRLPVVTLVRDPIAREISGVFQSPDLFRAALRDDAGAIDVETALAYLAERFSGPDPCGYAEQWFDRELAKTLGVDVFGEPFDMERGFSILRSARADVLVLRTEDLDRRLPEGLAELLNLSGPLPVLRANERDLTPDGEAYAQVRKAFRLPRSTVERIYAGRLARHFYSEETLAERVERWS